MIYDTVDIYYNFRKAQSEVKGRGFRMPKNFEEHLEKKFTQKNKEALKLATGYFNTKWHNIDPYTYFKCGFELFKTFSYLKFFDIRVMRLYVVKDKNMKREMSLNKHMVVDSVKFIRKHMKDNDIFMFSDYLLKTEGSQKLIIKHYLKNNVDKFLLVWLVKSNRLRLTEDDKAYVPYIVHKYRDIKEIIEEMSGFMRKVSDKL